MKSLIAFFVTFSTVIALAVPHPDPSEESGIDIATKFAAANVPSENDNLNEQPWHIKRYDDDNRGEDEHPTMRGGCVDSIVSPAVQDSLKRSEISVYYEYDDIGDFLESREHIYTDGMDENDSPEFITNEHPLDNVVNQRDEENILTVEGYYNQEEYYSKKRDANYIPFGTHNHGNLLARKDEDLEEIDADSSLRGKSISLGDDGTPNLHECLWRFKKDDNCVERSDEEKPQKREIEADDENCWRLKEGEYDGEVNFGYIPKRDNDYNEEEDECLKRIYEGIRYGGDKNYLPKRDGCCLGEHGDVDASQVGDDYPWGVKEAGDSCSCVSEVIDYPAGDYYDDDDNFTGVMEYEANEVEGKHYPSVGIVGKSTASHRHIGEYMGGPPADNGYLCETTKDSPTVVDVVEIANIFKHQRSGEHCIARNALDSKCTKLIEFGSAQLAICTIYTGWFVYCDDVGKYALELSRRCQSYIDGVWRVGGTIFHESGKGSLVVY